MGQVIFLEGGIGAGKTTAAERLGPLLGFKVFDEPIDQELLTAFYENPRRWAYAFQMAMLHSRWRVQMKAALEEPGAIVDRSLFGDAMFARLHMRRGNIHPIEWRTYMRAVENMCLVLFPPTLLIYLAADPQTCLERIKKRGRPQEAGITLEYLEQIDVEYGKLLEESKTAFWPWSHAMEIMIVPHDMNMATDNDWTRFATTVKKTLDRRSLPDYARR